MQAEKFNPDKTTVTLTPAAIAHFQRALDASPDMAGIRFSLTETGCSGYSYHTDLIAAPDESDLVVTNEAGLPLYMAPDAKALINGMKIDYEHQPLGQSQLIYENPHETARCGCGISFTIKD